MSSFNRYVSLVDRGLRQRLPFLIRRGGDDGRPPAGHFLDLDHDLVQFWAREWPRRKMISLGLNSRMLFAGSL